MCVNTYSLVKRVRVEYSYTYILSAQFAPHSTHHSRVYSDQIVAYMKERSPGKKSLLALRCFCNTLLIRLLSVSFTRSLGFRV